MISKMENVSVSIVIFSPSILTEVYSSDSTDHSEVVSSTVSTAIVDDASSLIGRMTNGSMLHCLISTTSTALISPSPD